MEKAQTKSHLSITSNEINIELSKEFLKELQMNAYHGWIDKDELCGITGKWGDEIEVSDNESSDLERVLEDGYCNGGNFPGAYHIGNSLHYQDLEWYEALEDSKLKDEALRNKAIMKGLISDDESSNDCWKRWKSHEIYYHNYDNGEYKNETHEEGHELCGIETHEVPVCQIKRYMMIKYSFNDEEEYVAVKEDEYEDLTITSEEACRAYQEIFQMMDEG
ncbi:hypothetical protein Tco_1112520 [Tanacetum coccineum]|uniref:Uncharacterized protein n=1 Tax=Tanacetum coccineum TaxID=301880 RepID=A0ABQ5IPP3_9ASTR